MNKIATLWNMKNIPMYIQDYGRGQPNGVPELNTKGTIDMTYFPTERIPSSLIKVSSEDPRLFTDYVLSLI